MEGGEYNMSFSEKLRSIRKENKYSVKEISEFTGIPYRSLQSYEMGVRTPSIEVLIKLSEFFKVTSDYLLDIEVDNSKEENENMLSEADEVFIKQTQEQLIQILKQKQNEINRLKKEIEILKAEKVDTNIN